MFIVTGEKWNCSLGDFAIRSFTAFLSFLLFLSLYWWTWIISSHVMIQKDFLAQAGWFTCPEIPWNRNILFLRVWKFKRLIDVSHFLHALSPQKSCEHLWVLKMQLTSLVVLLCWNNNSVLVFQAMERMFCWERQKLLFRIYLHRTVSQLLLFHQFFMPKNCVQ